VTSRLSKLAAIVVTISLAAASAAQASQPTWLEGSPCVSAAACHTTAMYKPHTFQLGSHYWFTNVVWKSWNQFTASAAVTLHYEFAGSRPGSDRTLVIFYRVRTLCGIRSYTRWISGDGNAQDAGPLTGTGTCTWFVGGP
jgi:hypothetical protein